MTTIDIEYAVNLMQALNRSFAGVAQAPDLADYPTSIDTGSGAWLLTWPSEASWYAKGDGWKVDDRTMQVIAFVEPLGQGEIPSRAQEAVQLLQRARSAYIDRANIPLAFPTPVTQPYQIVIASSNDHRHSDGGLVSNLRYQGASYHGFILNVNVRIMWS